MRVESVTQPMICGLIENMMPARTAPLGLRMPKRTTMANHASPTPAGNDAFVALPL